MPHMYLQVGIVDSMSITELSYNSLKRGYLTYQKGNHIDRRIAHGIVIFRFLHVMLSIEDRPFLLGQGESPPEESKP